MKPSKGKNGVAAASGTPASRPVQRVSNGLRRTGMAGKARPNPPPATGAAGRLKERLRARLYDLLAAEFTAYAKRSPTRKRLAAQLGQTPEEIGRWLSGPGALAGNGADELLAAAARPPRRARRPRKDAAPAADPAAVLPPCLTTGTTIAIGATMVGPGIATLASVDVNPVAQVEVV